jgi:hypothetical protein
MKSSLPPKKRSHHLQLIVAILCIFAGVGFYKTSEDLLTTVFFTIGLLGILASWIRGSALKEED